MNTTIARYGVLIIIMIVIGLLGWRLGTTDRSVTEVESTNETPAQNEILEVVPPDLTSTSWSWQRTVLFSGEATTAPAGERFILTFNTDSTVNSSTDCNRISSTYIQDGEVISFAPFAATRMFCEESQERAYTEQLSLANSFVIEGNTLRINLNRDFGTMYFVPAQ